MHAPRVRDMHVTCTGVRIPLTLVTLAKFSVVSISFCQSFSNDNMTCNDELCHILQDLLLLKEGGRVEFYHARGVVG